MHCIPLQVSKKKKRNTCMLIWEMLHDFIILTTFLLYFFNEGDVHESYILFKSEKMTDKVYRCFGIKIHLQIMARPFFKTSGFGCTVNFVFATLYLWCLMDDF